MRFGTLFSGIEGFGLGFERAGMECAFQCEIDDHCVSVLRRHYPNVPKWRDVSEVNPDELPDVDVLAFGSPCQDLSVAGRRKGLGGERSGLFVEAIRISDSLAPDWLVLENVPGMLSSNGGEDFAVVLEGFTGFRPAAPENGWREAGVCVGPLRWCAWRVLDTQFFGPPQRRRRVFVVGCSRAPCRPEVLLEPEGMSGHPAPSREARQGPSPLLEIGARTSGDGYRDGDGIGQPGDPMYTLQASKQHGVAATLDSGNARRPSGLKNEADVLVAHALPTKYRGDPHEGTDTIVAPPEAVAFTQNSRSELRLENGDGQVIGSYAGDRGESAQQQHFLLAQTITAEMYRSGGATAGNNPGVRNVFGAIPRRLTPRECESLQGFPRNWNEWGVDEDGNRVELSDSARYRQLGNAVTVNVAFWIGRRLIEATP
jgi:DNA (cytosine-5)-methyltransferase 1